MSRLIFLPVPESFKNQIKTSENTFSINPKIPIPIEIEEGNEEKALCSLTMDMIIKGMLRAIEENGIKQSWKDYYSGFVLFMRPDILEICQNEEAQKQEAAE
ncbi:MAG: hypothetical protein FWC01_02755 [Treponema sp.]|nr:hypothetical protein [Treponema sp.]MCL2236946.1 hypothetical protein [Treponema sp.]